MLKRVQQIIQKIEQNKETLTLEGKEAIYKILEELIRKFPEVTDAAVYEVLAKARDELFFEILSLKVKMET